MKTTFDYTGQSVLVTGASRGIGHGVAAAFAAAGANLTILSEEPGIEVAARELSAACGREVRALQCDIANRDAVRTALNSFDRLDILINNAGMERITPITEPDLEVEATFARIIEVNILGTFFITRDALPKMSKGGRIIFTASIWGRSGVPEFSGYCASKHAVIGFMRSLAMELGPMGINVNAVAPGWVKTDASMRSLKSVAERLQMPEDELREANLARQSLPGLMEPRDVAGLYLYLASPAASNITGQTINIDRGEVMS